LDFFLSEEIRWTSQGRDWDIDSDLSDFFLSEEIRWTSQGRDWDIDSDLSVCIMLTIELDWWPCCKAWILFLFIDLVSCVKETWNQSCCLIIMTVIYIVKNGKNGVFLFFCFRNFENWKSVFFLKLVSMMVTVRMENDMEVCEVKLLHSLVVVF
jgi:hypothetical protein